MKKINEKALVSIPNYETGKNRFDYPTNNSSYKMVNYKEYLNYLVFNNFSKEDDYNLISNFEKLNDLISVKFIKQTNIEDCIFYSCFIYFNEINIMKYNSINLLINDGCSEAIEILNDEIAKIEFSNSATYYIFNNDNYSIKIKEFELFELIKALCYLTINNVIM